MLKKMLIYAAVELKRKMDREHRYAISSGKQADKDQHQEVISGQPNTGNRTSTCCVAISCSDRNYSVTRAKGIKFHRFPANEDRRTSWINAMKRPNWRLAFIIG